MYNKLFTKILDSSIWLEPSATRLVWLTFIAAMDEDGFVQFASVANLAHRARVSTEEAQAAVECLESEDKNSSDPENGGRRAERVPGGWMILNAKKYRDMVTRAVIQEQTRLRVAKHRKAVKEQCNADVTQANESVTPSETRSEAETGSKKKEESRAGYFVPPCFAAIDGFTAALAGWIESRKKTRKPATSQAIQLLINRLSERPHQAVAALNEAIERGWMTVKWEWLKGVELQSVGDLPTATPDEIAEQKRHQAEMDEVFARQAADLRAKLEAQQ